MPSEFRRITFNDGELLEALVEYDKLADQSARLERLDFQPRVTIGELKLEVGGGSARGSLSTDAETFVRLTGGRGPDPGRYRMEGMEPGELVLFG